TRGGAARVAARHRSAVERRVELVLVKPEPSAEGLARSAAPRPPLLALDHAGRLTEDVRLLPGMPLEHGGRLDPKTRLGAGATPTVVTLQRHERPVRRAPPRHPRERTTTNQFP